MTIEEIKNRLESETGLKFSVKHEVGSMKGYVTFSAKRKNGEYPQIDWEYGRAFQKEFLGKNPHQSFFTNNRMISIFKQWYNL